MHPQPKPLQRAGAGERQDARPLRLGANARWPLPAVLAWSFCWAALLGLRSLGLAPWAALALACALGLACALAGSTRWRRAFIALGFPLSVALSGFASGASLAPGWVWLPPLLLLLLLYPLNAWRDAPLFPTPANALRELPNFAPLEPDDLVLDAGCGLGDGLKALRQAYPGCSMHGVEWSWPLRAACALRCPWARVRQGDLWRADWSGYALVYLFQRPESMARAAHKARTEMRPGSWLVSLEFEAQELVAKARLQTPDGRALWLYQIPAPTGSDGTPRQVKP